jgi:hypothetical protein
VSQAGTGVIELFAGEHGRMLGHGFGQGLATIQYFMLVAKHEHGAGSGFFK